MSPIILPPYEYGLGAGAPDFALPGTGQSGPGGVDATFSFGNLLLNDRTQVDKYRIFDIDGLADADVRDSRDMNPGRHGETAYEALYGGRTLVLTGRIEAFNLRKLRDMQQALKTAFMGLRELPLTITPARSQPVTYINCRKSASIAWKETQQGNWNFFRDFMVTLRASDPRFYGGTYYQDEQSFGYINGVQNPSAETNSTGWSIDASAGVSASTVTNITSDARFGSHSMDAQTAIVPGGGYVGFYGDGINRAECVPGDNVVIRASMKPISLSGAWASTQFALYARFYTSGGALLSSVQVATASPTSVAWYDLVGTTVVPASAAFVSFETRMVNLLPATNQTFQHRTDAAMVLVGTSDTSVPYFDGATGLNHGWHGTAHASTSYRASSQVLHTLTNIGNFRTMPLITVTGDVTNITIRNLMNNENVALTGQIPLGESRIIDITNHTVENQAGTNRFDQVAITSDWPELEPVTNYIEVSATAIGTTRPKVRFNWRDAWM